jgi:hypothetical protein
MLLRLLPDQVARYWEDVFKGPIASTLPPIVGESPDKMNNVLESFLIGKLVMWLTYSKVEEKVVVSGFVVTQIVVDVPTETRAVLLYSVYSPDGTSDQEWMEGFAAVSEYGRAHGCTRMTAYSNNPRVFERAEQFNGDSSYRFISFPIV